MKRILSAVVFLPLFYLIVRLPPLYFGGLIAVAAILALYEAYGLAAGHGIRCHRTVGAALMVGVLYSFFDPRLPLSWVLVAGLVGIPVLSLVERRPPRERLAADAVTLFAALFLGALLGYQVGLRGIGGAAGQHLIFLLYFVVWSGDTLAYYVGSAWGRHPLSPRISPKKTWEGAVAGILASLIASVLARSWFLPELGLADALIIGPLLALGGIVGDLVESAWKRGAGTKDSASLVPGHGGILDRSDSLLFAGPILYYYYLVWIQ